MKIALLSAYLWDLRAQCEHQVHALTEAQRQLDVYRDSTDGPTREAALKAIHDNLERVVRANLTVREAAADTVLNARELATRASEQQP